MLCGNSVGTGSHCHCEDCRKSTGGAFSVAIPFESDQFRVLGGRIGSYTKYADGGNELTRNFLPGLRVAACWAIPGASGPCLRQGWHS